MIATELKEHVLLHYPEARLADVRIGLGYTAVMLEDGAVGVAYTFHREASGGCSVFQGKRPLAGRTTTEVLEYLDSADAIEAAVGLACANALVNRPRPEHSEGDLLHYLSVGFLDRVGMVGFFGPIVPALRKRSRELLIFERDTGRAEGLLPAEEAFSRLLECDVAVITSTALMLGELDRLLEAAAGCREVALVGASTPLAPEVFRTRGVTLLSGVTVVDGPRILQVVSEGGGMGFFGDSVRKVNLSL